MPLGSACIADVGTKTTQAIKATEIVEFPYANVGIISKTFWLIWVAVHHPAIHWTESIMNLDTVRKTAAGQPRKSKPTIGAALLPTNACNGSGPMAPGTFSACPLLMTTETIAAASYIFPSQCHEAVTIVSAVMVEVAEIVRGVSVESPL